MGLSRHDAELMFDRAIPAGLIDAAAPDLLRPANTVRLVNVREKPAATRARMVKALATLALAGAVCEQDLARLGAFTAEQIREHAGEALAQVLAENPALHSIEWVA